MRQSEANPHAAERGMLYVELLGAIALLGMIIAGIAGMFLTAASENASSGDLTTSATLARDRAELLTGIPYPALVAGTVRESLRDRGKRYERVTLIEDDAPHPGMKTVTVTVEPEVASRYRPRRRITVRVYRVP
jgi:hypothetical protein